MKKPSAKIEALRDDCVALRIKLSLVEEKSKDPRAIAECREELTDLNARFQAIEHERSARPRRGSAPALEAGEQIIGGQIR